MSFFNDLQGYAKVNIFFGNFLTKLLKYPTKRELARALVKDMRDNLRGYIKDENSLFQVAQLYLDGLVGSKTVLQKKIKRLYDVNATNLEILDHFFESDKINAIFSTDYDLTLEKIDSYKVRKILPTDEIGVVHTEEKLDVKLYKILGDVTRYDLMFATTQDFRKLKVLNIHKRFFEKVKMELESYPTLILDIDLDDSDFIEILEYVLQGVENKGIIYATTVSNVLKTKTIERLNDMGIKLLPYSEKELYDELKDFLSIDFNLENSSNIEELIGKKYIR